MSQEPDKSFDIQILKQEILQKEAEITKAKLNIENAGDSPVPLGYIFSVGLLYAKRAQFMRQLRWLQPEADELPQAETGRPLDEVVSRQSSEPEESVVVSDMPVIEDLPESVESQVNTTQATFSFTNAPASTGFSSDAAFTVDQGSIALPDPIEPTTVDRVEDFLKTGGKPEDQPVNDKYTEQDFVDEFLTSFKGLLGEGEEVYQLISARALGVLKGLREQDPLFMDFVAFSSRVGNLIYTQDKNFKVAADCQEFALRNEGYSSEVVWDAGQGVKLDPESVFAANWVASAASYLQSCVTDMEDLRKAHEWFNGRTMVLEHVADVVGNRRELATPEATQAREDYLETFVNEVKTFELFLNDPAIFLKQDKQNTPVEPEIRPRRRKIAQEPPAGYRPTVTNPKPEPKVEPEVNVGEKAEQDEKDKKDKEAQPKPEVKKKSYEIGFAYEAGRNNKGNEQENLAISDLKNGFVGVFSGSHYSADLPLSSRVPASLFLETLLKEYDGNVNLTFDENTNLTSEIRERFMRAEVASVQALREQVESDPSKNPLEVSATVAQMFEYNGKRYAIVYHIGNTRAYIFRKDGKFKQITRDHSLQFRDYQRGVITGEELDLVNANINKSRIGVPEKLRGYWDLQDKLGQSISSDRRGGSDIGYFELFPEDKYIVVTSGGVRRVARGEMIKAVRGQKKPKKIAERLVRAVRKASDLFDVSVVCLKIPDDKEKKKKKGLKGKAREVLGSVREKGIGALSVVARNKKRTVVFGSLPFLITVGIKAGSWVTENYTIQTPSTLPNISTAQNTRVAVSPTGLVPTMSPTPVRPETTRAAARTPEAVRKDLEIFNEDAKKFGVAQYQFRNPDKDYQGAFGFNAVSSVMGRSEALVAQYLAFKSNPEQSNKQTLEALRLNNPFDDPEYMNVVDKLWWEDAELSRYLADCLAEFIKDNTNRAYIGGSPFVNGVPGLVGRHFKDPIVIYPIDPAEVAKLERVNYIEPENLIGFLNYKAFLFAGG